MTEQRWFHGTDGAAASAILREGFRDGTCFATTPEMAATFGPFVIEVEHEYVATSAQWHWRSGGVAAEKIVALRVEF